MGVATDTQSMLQRYGDVRVRQRACPPHLRLVENEVDMPRVVVISTSGLVRFQLRRELSPRGFVVVDVSGAAGCARAVKAACADVVLVDAASSTPAGRSLVRSLKEDPALRRTPVLFLEERQPSESSRQQVLSAGADGVAGCGDDFDALAATLTLHLRR